MHEVSLAIAVTELARTQAKRAGAQRITRLVLEIGVLSHVDVHALCFAIEAAARGGPAEGAVVDIMEPPGSAWCMDCAATVSVASRGAACSQCGGFDLVVQGGDELRLKTMEVV